MDRLRNRLPFLAAFFIAVFAMPTDVVQVNAKQMGTEHAQPWRAKLTGGLSSSIASLKDRCIALIEATCGHPLRGPALAGVAMLVAGIFAPEHVGAFAMVGVMGSLKLHRQNVADIETQIRAKKAERSTIADACLTGKRDMTDDERTKFASLKADITGLETKLDAAKELLAASEESNEAERRANPVNDADTQASNNAAHDIQLGADRKELDRTRGFKSVVDFARSVREACVPGGGGNVDKRLAAHLPANAAPTNYQSNTGTSGEGYEVPAEYRDGIFELAFPGDDLVSALAPEPTEKGAVDIEADETTPWGAAGVQAKWRNEVSQMVATKGDTKLRTVRLQELYAFVTASDELLSDAPRLQNRLSVKSAAAIQYKASEAVANGTGAGQPLGWMKSGALVTITKESGQAAATIDPSNVAKMYARLLQGGRNFWMANSDILPQLITMKIGDQAIWTPPVSGMKEAPGGMLLGMPIKFSEHAETLGTKGDLQGINPDGYYAAVKKGEGIQFASSIHLFFDYGLQAFRWTFRIGGQPYLSAPVSPAKGSATKSHFVCVETRS